MYTRSALTDLNCCDVYVKELRTWLPVFIAFPWILALQARGQPVPPSLPLLLPPLF